MKYLRIANDGILDIRLVALMGGTTKANDKFKIGQFGTGLKYTLAFLFRNNLDFRIFAGPEEIKFHLEIEEIRGESFKIICINGHRTSITTRMGLDWKAWMIAREIWCNALDEGGADWEITQSAAGENGKTIFYIQIDSQIQEVLDNWTKYFIHGIEPMFENKHYAIYPGGSTRRIYKNGVLIDEEENMKTMFAYDVKAAELNELREFKGHHGYEITHALFDSNERVAEYFLENIDETYYEGGDLSYDWWNDRWSPAWEKVIGSAKLIHPKALEHLKEVGADMGGEYVVIPKNVFTSLTKQFSHVSALRAASKIGEFFEDHNESAEKKWKQGLVILEACGYHLHPELKFVFGYFGDKNVQARIHYDEKRIYISNTLAQASLHGIISVILEESEHFNTGFRDCTREFQTHWINLYTRELLAKNSIEV